MEPDQHGIGVSVPDDHGAAALDGLDHTRTPADEDPLPRFQQPAAAIAEVMTSPAAGTP